MLRQSTFITLFILAVAGCGERQSADGKRNPETGMSTPLAGNPQTLQSTGPDGLPPGAVHLRRVEIIDPNGFGKPMVATTLLIPAGWQTQGGVVWGGQTICGGTGYNIDFQAISPHGDSAVHIYPMEHWQWNTTGTPTVPGCPLQQITTVRQYLEALSRHARPGARILEYRPRPDIEAQLSQVNQTTPMPLGEMRVWVEAGEVLIAYDLNGVDTREVVASAITFNLMHMNASMGMRGSDYLSASTFPGFAMRAPTGQLDSRLAETIRKSGRPNPEWTARIAQHNAKISSINIKGAAERSKIISQTGEEIRQMQTDSRRRYNESSDYLAREQSETLRGVETYNDPYYGNTVELDNTYKNAWQLNDGSYVLTDDPDFKPYPVFGQDGQQLDATQ